MQWKCSEGRFNVRKNLTLGNPTINILGFLYIGSFFLLANQLCISDFRIGKLAIIVVIHGNVITFWGSCGKIQGDIAISKMY